MLKEEVPMFIYKKISRKQNITIFIYTISSRKQDTNIRESNLSQGGSVVENSFEPGIVKSREHARPIMMWLSSIGPLH